MRPQTLAFFGLTGSGKGTQIKLLRDFFKNRDGSDTVYAYPGDEYRRIIESNSLTGSLVKGPLHRGELLPGFLTDAIVTNILMNSLTPNKHLITDGYPRAVAQSMSFEAMMKFYERKDVKVIYIGISKEEGIKRMKLRGRHDDTPEGIEKRFNEYVNNVIPAMNYFNDKVGYTIHTINGEQNVESVHQDIIKALGF